MSWCTSFPYLVPVWHSLGQHSLSPKAENAFDHSYDIDFGGMGVFNGTAYKHYRTLPYRILRPVLPFWLETDRFYSQFSARNCLAFDQKRKLLFASRFNAINGFRLEVDPTRFNTQHTEVDVHRPHRLSEHGSLSVNPFCHGIAEYHSHKDCRNENILEMKVFEGAEGGQLMCQSRSDLSIYSYPDQLDTGLHCVTRLDPASLFPDSAFRLDYWDRSVTFPEDLLTTMVDEASIFRVNLEVGKATVENSLGFDISENRNRFIGVEWVDSLNPFTYYFGTHEEIGLGDTRQNMRASTNVSLSLMQPKHFLYYKHFELLHTFTASLLDPHQLVVATDFNLNFFDIRYLNKNVKHMISNGLVKLMQVRRICPKNSTPKMLVVASNSTRSCLFSFERELSIQPSLLHSPFDLELPRQTPFVNCHSERNDYFIRGLQLLSGQCDPHPDGDDLLTSAFLLNNGDILMQDMWISPNSVKPEVDQTKMESIDLVGFRAESHSGNNCSLHEDFDPLLKSYLDQVKALLERSSGVKDRQSESMASNRQYCPVCCKTSGIKRREGDHVGQQADCTQSEAHFCLCLDTLAQKERDMLGSDDCDDRLVNTAGSAVLHGLIPWADNDHIDFAMIRDNWHSLTGHPDSPACIRDVCKPLTRQLFDPWCQADHDVPLKSEDDDEC